MRFSIFDFTDKYDDLFTYLFSSDEFDKYQHFFDKLIISDKIDVHCYEETDAFIYDFAELVDDPKAALQAFLILDCDYMFDFYERYYVLVQYLRRIPFVNVKSTNIAKVFIELFTKTWTLGVSNFPREIF